MNDRPMPDWSAKANVPSSSLLTSPVMHTVLVQPGFPAGLGGRLFEIDGPSGSRHYYNSPFRLWRQQCLRQGILLLTWDQGSPESADVFWFVDLPRNRRDVEVLKQRYPEKPIVLLLHESPADRVYFFEKKNHRLFDLVLTYDRSLCDEARCIHLPLCHDDYGAARGESFEQRKCIAMVQTNRHGGFLSPRGAGLTGLPVIGPRLGGWSVPFKALVSSNGASGYRIRRRFARTAERIAPTDFDLYGRNWNGESSSWIHKIIKPRQYKCLREPFVADKYDLLRRYRFVVAIENHIGSCGYISEKIFDGFYGDCVPIYLGDENISRVIPSDCFVDARRFDCHEALIRFCIDCDPMTWNQFIDAGRRFRNSREIHAFQGARFASTATDVLISLLGQ